MSTESDELMQSVLDEAKEAVEPRPAELAHALAGVRGQLAAMPGLGGTPDAGVTHAAGPGKAARLLVHEVGHLRWVAALVGAGVAGVAGFGLGVQHGRELGSTPPHAPAPGGTLAEQSSTPAAVGQPEPLEHTADATAEHESESIEHSVASEASALAPPAGPSRQVARARARLAPRTAPLVPGAAAPDAFTFDQVLDRLSRAQRAQRRSEPALATALLDEIDARANPAMLREERLIARVLAACDVGDAARAERAAGVLRGSADGAAYASRLTESCVGGAARKPSPGASSR